MRRMLTEKQIKQIAGGGGGSITPESLAEVLEGSETVVVDLNEQNTKLQVRLDQSVMQTVDLKIATAIGNAMERAY